MRPAGATPRCGGGAASVATASESEDTASRHARLLATLHGMASWELQAAIAPAQQRALLARYAELSDSSRLRAARRARALVDAAAGELREAHRGLAAAGAGGVRGALAERIDDLAATSRELGGEAAALEPRCVRTSALAVRPPPQHPDARPFLSQLFEREAARARAGRGEEPRDETRS